MFYKTKLNLPPIEKNRENFEISDQIELRPLTNELLNFRLLSIEMSISWMDYQYNEIFSNFIF